MPDPTKPADVMESAEAQALCALIERAQKGDGDALPELREWLEQPAFVDMLGGNLARNAERSLLDAAAGKDLLFREATLRKMELMRAELAGSNSTKTHHGICY